MSGLSTNTIFKHRGLNFGGGGFLVLPPDKRRLFAMVIAFGLKPLEED